MPEINDRQFLLLSKLKRPQSLAPSVPRPRLLAGLHDGLSFRATFVTAPAGYGKTTLLSEWVSQLHVPAGWLSLDEKDNDLIRFWSYMTEAIALAQGGLSDHIQAAATTLSPGHYESYIITLLNELSRLDKPLVLVLDDWHVIHDADIIASVSYFLEYLPSHLHLYFGSRTMNGFVRARWISRNWIQEICAEQLCFNRQEIIEFFRMDGKKELTREAIERISEQTEGWVTGLRLISLTARDRDEMWMDAWQIPSGTSLAHEGVERYLFEEVFAALDEATRQFLLDVSILQRMNSPLCEAVAGEHGADKLEELLHLNLFLIPQDDQREWYRFHHLFGEFLLREQQRRDPDKLYELYEAAAIWCEKQQLLEEAVDYYLAGAEYNQAIRLLEQMRSLMIRREFSTMRVWLSVIPTELLQQHPYLYFSYTFSLLWGQEVDLAERHLIMAERHFEAASLSWSLDEKNRYLGYLYYIRNFKATQYDMDMIKGLEYIQLSLKYSPNGTDLIFASPQMPLAPSIYRSYNGKRGEHLPRGLSDTFFQNMIDFMKQMGLEDSVVVCYGELLYERDELELAERYLKLGLHGYSQSHFQPEKVYVPASLFLARISRARQDIAEAEKWLEQAYRRASLDGASEAPIILDAELAALRLDAGDVSAAMEWKERYQVHADDPISVFQLYVYVFLVRVLMEIGQGQEAWALSKRLFQLAVKNHRPMVALDIQILQAMMLQREGKPQQALLGLEEALTYAEPDDYIRIFVDKGKSVAELLKEYVGQRQKGNLRDRSTPSLQYVRRILSSFGGAFGALPLPSGDSLEKLLTPREHLIFHYMEEGLDNPAIVKALGIGMGTLKAHINHIYSKLQAKNRVEAIKRGQKLQG
ncbi:LuxR C-terminal-related transcriptional regulator [Paenibacillus puldeungensis]|uniref:LuxR C-terminal-related transcriptional regulator n=1 Tax=Paenibacillus puldeungensis TaxID=696536 RepID=A0ABW3RZC8_9BACL